MEHMNDSNSTAAHVSGVSAVVAVTGVSTELGDDDSNVDPESNAAPTSSDDTEPDRKYL